MSDPLILAIPSKGRLKEQVETWLDDCGAPVKTAGGERGYAGRLDGLDGVQVRLLSAGDIAQALWTGEVHLGVTGEDLLREQAGPLDDSVMLMMALGFGRADLVVAAPKSWIDVDSMADLDEVAHLYVARTGRRLRVATKYLAQTRAFFARHHIADYRIAESSGATEGAPAAGAAELIVDITTTGATLEANSLKVLSDGVILKSQAQLAGSLHAPWNEARLAAVAELMRILEARSRAGAVTSLAWPAEQDSSARSAVAAMLPTAGVLGDNGLLTPTARVFAVTAVLAAAGVGPVTASRPSYVFEAQSAVVDALRLRLAAGKLTGE
jgi:ATP phosphoribosyltransferase